MSQPEDVKKESECNGSSGAYVFCFTRPTTAREICNRRLGSRSIMLALSHREVAALISPVPGAACAGVRRTYYEQTVAWVCSQAAHHEEILAQAMSSSAALPFALGTIAGSVQRVYDALEQQYSQIDTFLTSIQGMEEWNLRGRVAPLGQRPPDLAQSAEAAAARPAAASSQEAPLSAAPAARRDLRAGARFLEPVLLERLAGIAQSCQPHRAEPAPLNRIDQMELFNWTLLVPHTKRDELCRQVEHGRAAALEQGIRLELNGPRPAYSSASGVMSAAWLSSSGSRTGLYSPSAKRSGGSDRKQTSARCDSFA